MCYEACNMYNIESIRCDLRRFVYSIYVWRRKATPVDPDDSMEQSAINKAKTLLPSLMPQASLAARRSPPAF